MTYLGVLTIAAASAALALPVAAQTSDGVPGDRLVVPLPDISTLGDDEAQALTRDLAQMNVVISECPEYDVSDAEWQLMTGTTDALSVRLGLDPLAYDREYFRPAFSVMDDPDACATLGPQVDQVIARLTTMGGSTEPSTPGLAAPAPEAPPPATSQPATTQPEAPAAPEE